jgi:hypothetical protein
MCKSVVKNLRHGNYICKSEGNYLASVSGLNCYSYKRYACSTDELSLPGCSAVDEKHLLVLVVVNTCHFRCLSHIQRRV